MMQPPRFEPHAILVADMVGYSSWLAEEPAATHTAFSSHLRNLFEPAVRQHGGSVIKTTGDGFLATFRQSVAAELCARRIQHELQQQALGNVAPASLISYRIAVHFGEIVVEPHDVFGLAVNTAIHMQALASPGGICISDPIFNSLPEEEKLRYTYVGQKYLKNIPDPIPIFSSEQHGDTTGSLAHAHAQRGFLNPRARVGIADLDVLAAGDSDRVLSRVIHNVIFRGLSTFYDLLVAVPVASTAADNALQKTHMQDLMFKELHLDYVLYGSFLSYMNECVLTLYLEQIRSKELLWVGTVSVEQAGAAAVSRQLVDEVIAPIAFHLQRNEMDSHGRQWRTVDENRFRMAQRLLARGTLDSTDRARHLLSSILDRCGDIGDVHVALARAEHLHGRLLAGQPFVDALERARRHAVRAIEIDDLNAQAHSELALQEMFLKRQVAAEAIYHRALRLNPHDPMLQADWADCLTFMGRAQEALPILEKVATGWPRDRTWVEWNLCDTLWALDRPDRIVEILDYRSELPHVHRYLAAANAKLGRAENAKWHAEKVRSYQPTFSTREWSKVVPYTKDDTGENYAEYLERAGL